MSTAQPITRTRHLLGWLASTGLLLAIGIASAAPVNIPNSDFSAAGNNGSVGGGLIGAPATTTIAGGPWASTYRGIDLGLTTLAAPTMTIGSGSATASGLIYTSLLGGINNQGRFHQTLAENVTPGMRYTLKADIDTGSVLSLSVLGTGNAGIALGNGSTTLASSQTGTPLLELLHGTTHRVTLSYDAPSGASGPLQVILLAEPSGIVTANLLASVRFDNISLEKQVINQIPASVTPTSSVPPIAICGLPVSPGISVTVLDVNGDPIPNLPVNYSAPTSGASLNPPTGSVLTNNLGIATFTPLANTIAGTYPVVVTVPSSGTTTTLTLTNVAGPAASVGSLPGATPTAVVSTPFSSPVSALVGDQYGNPVSGVTVLFNAPTSGASAVLTPTSAVTDSNGVASVAAVANAIAGNYEIAVSVPSTGVQGTIALSNRAGPGTHVGPPGGIGGPIPSTTVTTAFSSPARALVTDSLGNPIQGVEVFFNAPASGASATFSAPSAITDATGIASVDAVANSIAGSYAVAVSVPSTGAQSTIPLTNLAGEAASIGAPPGGVPVAEIGQPFSKPIAAKVEDAYGNPVPGQQISFTAPSEGPTALLSSPTATTDEHGIAQVTAVANMIAGDYSIGTSTGGGKPVSGALAVMNRLPPTIITTLEGTPDQSADINAVFNCLLLVRAVDSEGVVQPNLSIDFNAPSSGPSATLIYGTSSGISLRVPTDEDGIAWVEARGNDIAGIYAVTADLAFSSSASTKSFTLRNLAAGDAAYSNGFDGLCVRNTP